MMVEGWQNDLFFFFLYEHFSRNNYTTVGSHSQPENDCRLQSNILHKSPIQWAQDTYRVSYGRRVLTEEGVEL